MVIIFHMLPQIQEVVVVVDNTVVLILVVLVVPVLSSLPTIQPLLSPIPFNFFVEQKIDFPYFPPIMKLSIDKNNN